MKLNFTGILVAALILSGCTPPTSTAQPAGLSEYMILFVRRENEPAFDLRVASGGIVRVNYHSDVFPESLQANIVRDSSEVILAPESR